MVALDARQGHIHSCGINSVRGLPSEMFGLCPVLELKSVATLFRQQERV